MIDPLLICLEMAELGLALNKIKYFNKPFPKDNYAQAINKEGLVEARLSRKNYNILKNKPQYEEYKLPREEGLEDWIGLRLCK